MAEFSSDERMRKISALAQEPFFASDEAKIWDVSMDSPEELIRRCSEYAGEPVSLEDLKQPLRKLLPQLRAKRRNHLQ